MPMRKRTDRTASPSKRSGVEEVERIGPLNSDFLAESLWPDGISKDLLNSMSLKVE